MISAAILGVLAKGSKWVKGITDSLEELKVFVFSEHKARKKFEKQVIRRQKRYERSAHDERVLQVEERRRVLERDE